MPLPIVTPMQATLVAKAFHHDGWVYEEKVDGYRMLAYKDGATVTLLSRQDRDHTKRFRELAAGIAALPADQLVLDGEVAVFDERFVSRFEWLRERPKAVATPPIYMAFDCLYVDGRDLRQQELRERRGSLEKVIADQSLILPARRLALDGLAAWREVLRSGYEGMVAKDETSSYVPGRTLKWLKVKQPKYREVERGFYKP
jgi:bifunctional non-homologous end joining protein LigD